MVSITWRDAFFGATSKSVSHISLNSLEGSQANPDGVGQVTERAAAVEV